MLSVVDVLTKTEVFFKARGIASPRLDAELLMGWTLGLGRVELYLQYDRPLVPAELVQMREAVRRRGEREPLAWITGTKSFWKVDLAVDPGVLVPRPDTELLVEQALECIPDDQELFIADIGCGSGAVGLCVLHDRPLAKLFAIDPSPHALSNTRKNAEALDLSPRVATLKGTGLDPVPDDRPIDWVLSNPPYIPTELVEGLAPEVRDHEPRLALDGGPDGLDVIRALLPVTARRARQGVLFEMGHDQGPAVSELFAEAGFIDIAIHKDLSGHDRVVSGRISK